MPLTILSGEQAGVTVNEAVQVISDSWGGNPDNQRFKNTILRRYNRVIREINNRLPKARLLRIVGATATLIAGTDEYDVTLDEENGGFGWTDCEEVTQLVFQGVDNRPLEKIDLETWRERSELAGTTGPPETWVMLDHRRIKIWPVPQSALVGFGDYLTALPSISAMASRLEGVPKKWDEAILAGIEFYTALAKMREQPASIAPYERRYESALSSLVQQEKTSEERPQRAVVTRSMRSRRSVPHDNSTDARWYR